MKIYYLLVFILMMSACSSKPAAVKKYYRIETTSHNETVQKHDATVWIAKPDAHSILGSRPMVATDSEGALQQLSHHTWLESPKILIQEQLQKALSQQWQSVVTDRPRNLDYYQLHSRILAFEKKQSQAHVRMTFKLLSPDLKVVKQLDLSSIKTINGESYAVFAEAISAALENIFKQLELTP